MVTYGGMSKKPITVSTSAFIFKVSLTSPNTRKQCISIGLISQLSFPLRCPKQILVFAGSFSKGILVAEMVE